MSRMLAMHKISSAVDILEKDLADSTQVAILTTQSGTTSFEELHLRMIG